LRLAEQSVAGFTFIAPWGEAVVSRSGKSSSWVAVLRDQIATLKRLRDNARESSNDDRARRLDAMLADYEAYLENYLREHPDER
jgi:hypothetical protein